MVLPGTENVNVRDKKEVRQHSAMRGRHAQGAGSLQRFPLWWQSYLRGCSCVDFFFQTRPGFGVASDDARPLGGSTPPVAFELVLAPMMTNHSHTQQIGRRLPCDDLFCKFEGLLS